ncbi:MAG: MarR family winged helix-turn-helix transcriptional regulator [Kibdelosporangium sp.]
MHTPPPALTELPSWLLAQVTLQAGRIVSEALAEEGVRRHHYTVLLTLSEQGSSQADLGRRLGIDRSDLHAVLNDLEGDDLVARVRDEEDRRRNVVELTTKGATILKRLAVKVEEAQDALLRPLSKSERAVFNRILKILLDHHR